MTITHSNLHLTRPESPDVPSVVPSHYEVPGYPDGGLKRAGGLDIQPPTTNHHRGTNILDRGGGELQVICKERPEPSLGNGMIEPKRALLAHANVGFSQSRLQPCGGLS